MPRPHPGTTKCPGARIHWCPIPMKRLDVLNRSEQRTLDLLERSLLGKGYRVYTQMPLKRLMKADAQDDLTYEEKRMLLHGTWTS